MRIAMEVAILYVAFGGPEGAYYRKKSYNKILYGMVEFVKSGRKVLVFHYCDAYYRSSIIETNPRFNFPL
jgi:hypothetical protein